MNSVAKIRRNERKLKKLTAELYLSGVMSADSDTVPELPVIRQQIRAKRKRDLVPKIYFNADRDYKKAVSISELQNFIISSVLHSQSPVKPRFCQITPWRAVTQTVFILVDCDLLCETNIFDDEFHFFRRIPFVSGNFLHRFYVNFDQHQNNFDEFYRIFFQTPISLMDRIKLVRKNDSTLVAESEEILEERDLSLDCKLTDIRLHSCTISVDSRLTDAASHDCKLASTVNDLYSHGAFGKTHYLMTLSDMTEDNYPIPDRENLNQTDFGYSMTAYGKVTDDSPIFAVDCEMCMTGPNRRELTRISIIDEQYNIVLDTLVKPKYRITDYLTRFSGITEKMLRHVRTTLADVQAYLKRILPADAILCGHSLNFDLDSMRVYHPYSMDVSVLYNLSGNRKSRSSLRTLTQTFLGETIQNSSTGHCSVEDAYATMKLLHLKLANGLVFGNVQMGWSYGDYAKNNNIDRSTGLRKRKHVDDEYSDQKISSKRAKIEVEKKNFTFNCIACGSKFQPNCLNNDCLCRRLIRSKCLECLPPADQQQKLNLNMILPESVFDVPSNGVEWVFDLFKRKKKKLLWATIREQSPSTCHNPLCELAMESRACRHIHVTDNESCVDCFKSNLMENDLNVLEVNCRDTNVEQLDDVAQQVLNFTARNALVCLIFKQHDKAVCCLKVKR